MLEELDYEVKIHPAVVLWGLEEPVEQPPTHIVLTVEIAGSRYLVDTGFGAAVADGPAAPARRCRATHPARALSPHRRRWRLAPRGEGRRGLARLLPHDAASEIDADGINEVNEFVSTSPQFRDRTSLPPAPTRPAASPCSTIASPSVRSRASRRCASWPRPPSCATCSPAPSA